MAEATAAQTQNSIFTKNHRESAFSAMVKAARRHRSPEIPQRTVAEHLGTLHASKQKQNHRQQARQPATALPEPFTPVTITREIWGCLTGTWEKYINICKTNTALGRLQYVYISTYAFHSEDTKCRKWDIIVKRNPRTAGIAPGHSFAEFSCVFFKVRTQLCFPGRTKPINDLCK